MRDSILAARLGDGCFSADGLVAFEFRFKADDPVFAGHFPGHPIVPGVFQLEMTRMAAESIIKCPLSIREIRKAKFQRPILPGETLRAELKISESGGEINARAAFSVSGQAAGETALILWRSEP
jgi:3-hydroxyacyl-[acyl-carrier-protein] dehydratase